MKNRRSRLILTALTSIVFFLSPITGVKSQTSYDTYLPLVKNHEKIGFDTTNRTESLEFFHTHYRIENPPPINWSGLHSSCYPGITSPSFQDAILQRINYFRAMAGVPADVTFSHESNQRAQAAALLISVNHAYSHNPSTTWDCYSSTAHEGASSSNLFIGLHGWDAITGYMRDPGEFNSAVGHRRWILYPQTKIMGTGDIPTISGYTRSNALQVFDEHMLEPRPQTRDRFVAWPPPGYVPYPVVFARWSFSYPQADFTTATVNMTQFGNPIPINQAPVVTGFGENTIVWQIKSMDCGQDWPRPLQDTPYTIQINNVMIDCQYQSFTYKVIIFDPSSS